MVRKLVDKRKLSWHACRLHMLDNLVKSNLEFGINKVNNNIDNWLIRELDRRYGAFKKPLALDTNIALIINSLLVYLETAFVPSLTACLASSPGKSKSAAVWISRELIVDFLAYFVNS